MKKNPPDQGGNVAASQPIVASLELCWRIKAAQPSSAVAADQIGTMNVFNEGQQSFRASDSQFKPRCRRARVRQCCTQMQRHDPNHGAGEKFTGSAA